MSKKIISNILHYAAQEGADNITITGQPSQVSLDCHFPDGERKNFRLPAQLGQDFLAGLRPILSVLPGELTVKKYCKIFDRNRHLAFYLTIAPEKNGEKIIINLINRPEKFWRLNQLGLETADLRELKKILATHSGLIIIGSPPGGGKSSTLYSLLEAINDPKLNIYLLAEQPERTIPGVNSLLPVAANWEKIIRHDSEVIAADSLDEDWALKNALRAAASGRLVLGTLTASSPREIVAKILKIDLPLKLKLDSLKLIVSQHLIDLKHSTKPRAKQTTAAKNRRKIIGSFEFLKLMPAEKETI
ncbi:MAG: ATPase, T2SS/T4P/T4SS family [Patescibacteria group bacterium]